MVTHHQGMQIQTTAGNHYTALGMAVIKKAKKIASVGQDASKGTLSHCGWAGKVQQPLRRAARTVLRKLQMQLLYDPGTALGNVPSEEAESGAQRGVCTPTFTAALLTRAKTRPA